MYKDLVESIEKFQEQIKQESSTPILQELCEETASLCKKKGDIDAREESLKFMEKDKFLLLLPISPKSYSGHYSGWSVKRLNETFNSVGLEFKKYTDGGGRAIWYTENGMNTDEAREASSANKTSTWTEPAERQIYYHWLAGRSGYGSTSSEIIVRLWQTFDYEFYWQCRKILRKLSISAYAQIKLAISQTRGGSGRPKEEINE